MDLLLQHVYGTILQENIFNADYTGTATNIDLSGAVNSLPSKPCQLVSTTDCWVCMIDPNVDADVTATTGMRLVANIPLVFSLGYKKTHISVLQVDTAGSLNVAVL